MASRYKFSEFNRIGAWDWPKRHGIQLRLTGSGIAKIDQVLREKYKGLVILDGNDIVHNEDIKRNKIVTCYDGSTTNLDYGTKIFINTDFSPKTIDLSFVCEPFYNKSKYPRNKGIALAGRKSKIIEMPHYHGKNFEVCLGLGLVSANFLYGLSVLYGMNIPGGCFVTDTLSKNPCLNTPMTFDSRTNKNMVALGLDQIYHRDFTIVKEARTNTIDTMLTCTHYDQATGIITCDASWNGLDLEKSHIYADGDYQYENYYIKMEVHCYSVIPELILVEAPDTWAVEKVPYNIDAVQPNGNGNLLLQSSNVPPVVGYTKSKFSYQDLNGVTKLLSNEDKELEVAISRSVDDTFTTVVIEGAAVQITDRKFALLVLSHDPELDSTCYYKITSPSPGKSNKLKIYVKATPLGPILDFEDPIHNALIGSIAVPDSIVPFTLNLNVSNGIIDAHGGFISHVNKKQDKRYLSVTVLPIRINYYPHDNAATTDILSQALTMKVNVEAVNNKLLLATGVSTLNYSYSTTSGRDEEFDGVSCILPTSFSPYLRDTQLNTEAVVVNGDTIGFTVNTDDIDNKRVIETNTGFTDKYFK